MAAAFVYQQRSEESNALNRTLSLERSGLATPAAEKPRDIQEGWRLSKRNVNERYFRCCSKDSSTLLGMKKAIDE